ncbi:MAG TPA: helix-turn-helix domain-containing protein [Acidimicrobiales bacterium]|nr:helix-turn-helix domain-containing protein [Acidimicrobiales bacterium]
MSVTVNTCLEITGRWQPDSRGRFQEAALALDSERGFEQTTVAEIPARVGLTERTFYRHFTEKREVLFRGAERSSKRGVRARACSAPRMG